MKREKFKFYHYLAWYCGEYPDNRVFVWDTYASHQSGYGSNASFTAYDPLCWRKLVRKGKMNYGKVTTFAHTMALVLNGFLRGRQREYVSFLLQITMVWVLSISQKSTAASDKWVIIKTAGGWCRDGMLTLYEMPADGGIARLKWPHITTAHILFCCCFYGGTVVRIAVNNFLLSFPIHS